MEEAAGGQFSQVYSLNESKEDNRDVSLASVGLLLPCEIFFEILSWLPVKNLVRCKCVCKQWYKLIEDRTFIVKHLSRTKAVTVYFEDKVESLDVDGTIVQEKFKIMSMFAGLIVEKGKTSSKYRLRNFTTQEILYLPNPHEDTFIISSHYNLAGEIKLVSVYGDENINSPEGFALEGFEVLNLDRDDKWRPLEFPILKNFQTRQWASYQLILSNDTIYNVRQDGYGSNVYIDVCSFDMRSECFFNNTLPQCFFSDLSKVMVLDWNSCVAFGDIVEDKLNVVVLEDHKMHKWSETKIVIPLTFLKENPDIKKLDCASFCDSSKLSFYSEHKDGDDHQELLFVYDTQLRKLTETRLVGSGPGKRNVCPSVVTFNRNAIGEGHTGIYTNYKN
ncbi:hypothetical protein LWI28_019178 [Acer negundo]|uniref:F-box domain-containing protein n=1 Tax=Acer negundo TaxID=4023 RepID=A0AAD5P4M7_ACENE|nr:hypothetical protein LWI28_019178 [Acer negundo]KAK4858302.1 hypothetical protein QYF36_014272 [Acer negundo]